jgi:hypothetical protein
MTAVVLGIPKEQARGRAFEAVDLDGDLRADPVLSLLSDADLETAALELHQQAETSMLACCDVVVELVRRRRGRTSRAKALADYQLLTNRSGWMVYQMLAVGRYWTPERRALYPTLTFEVLAETVRHTHRDGDTPRSREERIARVAKEAADADLNAAKTKDLARAIDRPDPPLTSGSRSDYLELDEPAPQPVEAPPLVATSETGEHCIPLLLRGLERRFREDNPGTPAMMLACVEDHLWAVWPGLPFTVTVTA